MDSSRYVLVIHGGAGSISKKNTSPEKEKAYLQSLQEALDAGKKILSVGGSALDAVEAAVRNMENNPMFNAGKGAVFSNEGKNELDASIMDGKTLSAGAIAGVTTIKNPITAARAVMEKSPHVMLARHGAEQFAAQIGCEIVDPSYFKTEESWNSFLRVKVADSLRKAQHDTTKKSFLKQPENPDYKYGTVGAVALDKHGNLAAATSTGGMMNKRYDRIGDSPIIGAGTYANNKSCAISCTGWGEYFIRLVMAKAVSDRMELAHETLQQASDEMINHQLPALGGDGGLIGVDKDGNVVMFFNTAGMSRGYIKSNGERKISLYKD